MSAPLSGLVLDLHCVINAPRERVFATLTDPVEVTRWWGPQGFAMPQADLQLTLTGGYRFSMQPPEGDLFHISGEFVEIDPPGRLAFTFRYDEPTPDDRESVVTLTLAALDADITEVSLSQGPFSTDERLGLHRRGWTDSLEKLRSVVETGD